MVGKRRKEMGEREGGREGAWGKEGEERKRTWRKKTDFPGSIVVRICLPMQGHGFDPWSGKIPHAEEQLSPCTTAIEPVH